MAVAYIISSLGTKRSHKDSFPKEKILSIISDMKAAGKLDSEICYLVLNEYSQIIKNTDVDCDPVIKIYLGILNEYKKLQTKINY